MPCSRPLPVLLHLVVAWRSADAHGGVGEEHYVFARQQYPQAHGRALTFASPWAAAQNIRINVQNGSLAELSTPHRDFLSGRLLPAAIGWLERALSVIPVSGVLRAARVCQSHYTSNGICSSEGTAVCGVAAETDATHGRSRLTSL